MKEYCTACDDTTGRAGRSEDSLYIESGTEEIGPLCERCFDYMVALEENKKLKEGIKAVRELINGSVGVYGLHLNDEGADWDSLLAGGAFEEWLIDFSIAEECVDYGDPRTPEYGVGDVDPVSLD